MADGSATPSHWFAAADLVGLPGLPGTERGIHMRAARESWQRRGRAHGKGWEYEYASLPPATQAAIVMRDHPAGGVTSSRRPARTDEQIASAWTRFDRVKQPMKDAAARRLKALHAVESLVRAGMPLMQARGVVARQMQDEGIRGSTSASIARWQEDVKGAQKSDWLPLLLPHYAGRTVTADCHPEAWAILTALYLSKRQDAFSTCYRRAKRAALQNGWSFPSEKTLARRLEREFTTQEIAYLRGGQEALDKLFPAQQRDRSMFEAMGAVNGDGVLFVPWVTFPTGELARPKVWVWQDLGTGKILAWRADVSENTDMLRLAFGDLVERYGLPRDAYLDNTMAAANTVMTGGVRNRYRFPVKEESITGIMPMCGVNVHFVRPAHGQAKPIERAFRDLRELIDHHPKYGNRGVKANPLPYDEWLAIFEAEIAAHNAQTGRRGAHFAGRSYDQVFAESYARVSVRKATIEQRRLWLLAADKITVNRVDGSIALGRGPMGENRYWCEPLLQYIGRKVVARFDPQRLHDPVHVYTLGGEYIGAAECTWRAGFADSEAGRAYWRARDQFDKATRAASRAKVRMDELSAINRVPDVAPPPAPESKTISLTFSERIKARAEEQPAQATGTDGGLTSAEMFAVRLARKRAEEAL
jgi:hypothetical protein